MFYIITCAEASKKLINSQTEDTNINKADSSNDSVLRQLDFKQILNLNTIERSKEGIKELNNKDLFQYLPHGSTSILMILIFSILLIFTNIVTMHLYVNDIKNSSSKKNFLISISALCNFFLMIFIYTEININEMQDYKYSLCIVFIYLFFINVFICSDIYLYNKFLEKKQVNSSLKAPNFCVKDGMSLSLKIIIIVSLFLFIMYMFFAEMHIVSFLIYLFFLLMILGAISYWYYITYNELIKA
jgi:uncharacterized Tic20 family protein